MCLITTQKRAKTADKDMTVYKCLVPSGDKLKAVYRYFFYEYGVLYTTKIKKGNDWCCFDDKDRTWLDENFPLWQNGKKTDLISLGEGFHSAKTRKRLKDNGEDIFRCTIPAGSKYYEDATGLIISNQLIVHKPLISYL
jgi:hypothetical protein